MGGSSGCSPYNADGHQAAVWQMLEAAAAAVAAPEQASVSAAITCRSQSFFLEAPSCVAAAGGNAAELFGDIACAAGGLGVSYSTTQVTGWPAGWCRASSWFQGAAACS